MVALRALSAGHLISARAFDAARTVEAREVEALSPITPFRTAFTAVGAEIGDAIAGPAAALDRREMRNLTSEPQSSRPLRVYMHPRTANLYGEGVPGDGGAVLVPRAMLSRDDSNLVKVLFLPKLLATAGALATGDGSAPSASTNPSPGLLSNPFERTVSLWGVAYDAVPANAQTLREIERAIIENVATFPLGALR